MDTGLLVSHSFDEGEMVAQNIHNRILTGDIELNKGMLVENVVAQMFAACGQFSFPACVCGGYFAKLTTQDTSIVFLQLCGLFQTRRLDPQLPRKRGL